MADCSGTNPESDAARSIAIVGATGMLGLPVARAFVLAGWRVLALTRSAARAARTLPDACEIRQVAYDDPASLGDALRGCDAVHINIASGWSPREPDPTVAVASAIANAAPNAGATRISFLSALEANAPAGTWWNLDRKREAEQVLLDGEVPATIFRPTWFSETLSLFRVPGPVMPVLACRGIRRRWLAADDFARVIEHALLHDEYAGSTIELVGPESLSFLEAARRYASGLRGTPTVVPVPDLALTLGSLAVPRARYLRDLLAVTAVTPEPEGNAPGLPACVTRVEQAARTS